MSRERERAQRILIGIFQNFGYLIKCVYLFNKESKQIDPVEYGTVFLGVLFETLIAINCPKFTIGDANLAFDFSFLPYIIWIRLL